MIEQFELFIKERQFISNVSPTHNPLVSRIVRVARYARADSGRVEVPCHPHEGTRTQSGELQQPYSGVERLPSLAQRRHIKVRSRMQTLRIPKLKEERRGLPTYDQSSITKLMEWKPKEQVQTRLQTLVMTLADTGDYRRH